MTTFDHLPDAAPIYQAHLDALSAALLSGDVGCFAARLALPYRTITEDGEHVFETHEDIAHAFQGLHRTLTAQRVTQYERLVKRADYRSETCICGEHETNIMSGALRLAPPYPNRVRLELIDGAWMETISANAIRRGPHFMLMPKVSAQPVVPGLPVYDPERTSHND